MKGGNTGEGEVCESGDEKVSDTLVVGALHRSLIVKSVYVEYLLNICSLSTVVYLKLGSNSRRPGALKEL